MSTQGQLVSNLLGGISQQPEDKRSPTQARDARNVYFSALEGAKRWPTQHVDQFSALADPDSVLIAYDRQDTAGADQQYFALVGKGQINVVDADGTSYPVRDTTTPSVLGHDSDPQLPWQRFWILRGWPRRPEGAACRRHGVRHEPQGHHRGDDWAATGLVGCQQALCGPVCAPDEWGVKLQVRCKVAGKDEFTVEYSALATLLITRVTSEMRVELLETQPTKITATPSKRRPPITQQLVVGWPRPTRTQSSTLLLTTPTCCMQRKSLPLVQTMGDGPASLQARTAEGR